MKFIKVFADDANYKAYRDGGSYEMPNVSLSKGNGTRKVYYNVDAKGKIYEDLGLPSGTLWATMNVGAKKPSDAGLYFQWGDTSGYTAYQVGKYKQFKSDWSDYKWGKNPNFTKYKTPGATLELEDDAAHVNMGGDWHMPTPEQIKELLDNTNNVWTTQDGVNGRLFTSSNGKSIFIPAVGYASNGSVKNSGSYGNIWTPVMDTLGISDGQYLRFVSGNIFQGISLRYIGSPVRGVIG